MVKKTQTGKKNRKKNREKIQPQEGAMKYTIVEAEMEDSPAFLI
jgi:hypothetical protein